MKSLTTLIFAVLITGLSAQAQSQPQEQPPVRELRVMMVADQVFPNLFYRSEGGEYQPLSVGHYSRGSANLIPAGKDLGLFTKRVNSEGKESMQPAAKIDLPAGDEPLLLVFYLGDNGRIVNRVINDSPDLYNAGQVYFMNLSDSRVACQMGEGQVMLQPGEGKVAGVTLAPRERVQYLYVAEQPDGSMFKSTTKNLMLPVDNMRMLVVFSSKLDEQRQVPQLVVRDTRVYGQVEGQPQTRLN